MTTEKAKKENDKTKLVKYEFKYFYQKKKKKKSSNITNLTL